MTRSLLSPIRTRRVTHVPPVWKDESEDQTPAMSAGTRKTLAAIGALWVSFATSAYVTPATASLPSPNGSASATPRPDA